MIVAKSPKFPCLLRLRKETFKNDSQLKFLFPNSQQQYFLFREKISNCELSETSLYRHLKSFTNITVIYLRQNNSAEMEQM